MPTIPAPPPDLPEVSGNKPTNKQHGKHAQSRQQLAPNYNNNNGLSPAKSSGTESSSNTSSKNTTPSHPTTQSDRTVSAGSPTSKPPHPSLPPQQADQLDPGEKSWERCWSLGELKQSSSEWTLAGDAGLLKYVSLNLALYLLFSRCVCVGIYRISPSASPVALTTSRARWTVCRWSRRARAADSRTWLTNSIS